MVVEKRKLASPSLPTSSIIANVASGEGIRSAFLPYKPSVTVLTNFQRGNTRAKLRVCQEELSFFQLAAKGDLTPQQIQNEANLNELDEEDCGLTALMWASAYGQYHTVEDLLKFGALADLSNNQGQSALHFAAKAGYPEVITTLANYGANINLPDGRGNTALILASTQNHSLTVSSLLAKGADLSCANHDGLTAYMSAVQRCHFEVQQVLENHMRQLLTGDTSSNHRR